MIFASFSGSFKYFHTADTFAALVRASIWSCHVIVRYILFCLFAYLISVANIPCIPNDVHDVHSWAIHIQTRMRTILQGMPGVGEREKKKKEYSNLKFENRKPTHRTNIRIIKYSGPFLAHSGEERGTRRRGVNSKMTVFNVDKAEQDKAGQDKAGQTHRNTGSNE